MISIMNTYMGFAQETPDLYQRMFQRPVPEFEPSEASMAVSLEGLAKFREKAAYLLGEGELQTNLPFEEARDLFIAMDTA